MVAVASWGKLGSFEHDFSVLPDGNNPANLKPGIAFGMGRSYGDVCLNPDGVLWNTNTLDRFIHFDESTGKLKCEAGVLLGDIQRLMVPRGFMLPVTPGTQFVTVGGAIANDVHGKNHHVAGSFGHHILWLKLLRSDGSIIECAPDLLPEWFAATVGGVGLTGIIIEVEIQLQKVASPWVSTETIPYANLQEFFCLADESEIGWEHTVSWIDCLHGEEGRGLFMRAHSIEVEQQTPPRTRKLTMPFVPPFSLVNKLTLQPFNSAYFNIKKWRSRKNIAHYESFFYPLDNLLEWNRMYGSKGFFQYQCVIPREVAQHAVSAMLKEIARAKEGSFLTVLKTFGSASVVGMLSFPMPCGVTLALDFPNKGKKTLKLFERLDAILREADGRIYLAKDARMPRDLFEAGYPRLKEFLPYRDPGVSSALSRRLMGS